ITGVTYQAKFYGWDTFKTIPDKYFIDTQGEEVNFPLAVKENPGETAPVFLNMKQFSNDEVFEGNMPSNAEGELKFRAVFDGGVQAAGASAPVAVAFDRARGAPSDATAQVGPAVVDLLTGQFTMNKTDVAIPVPGTEASLEFTRVYKSTAG